MRKPRKRPHPDDFEGLDRFILCRYDLNEWFSRHYGAIKALTGAGKKLGKREKELLAEQVAHKEFYQKMRDSYWAAREASRNAPVVASDDRPSFRTNDPYFNPPKSDYCSCTPSACRCKG
jgi:hypothetical protein